MTFRLVLKELLGVEGFLLEWPYVLVCQFIHTCCHSVIINSTQFTLSKASQIGWQILWPPSLLTAADEEAGRWLRDCCKNRNPREPVWYQQRTWGWPAEMLEHGSPTKAQRFPPQFLRYLWSPILGEFLVQVDSSSVTTRQITRSCSHLLRWAGEFRPAPSLPQTFSTYHWWERPHSRPSLGSLSQGMVWDLGCWKILL